MGAPAPLRSLQFAQLNSIVPQKLHHDIVMTLVYAMFHKLASMRTVLQLLKHLTSRKAARSGTFPQNFSYSWVWTSMTHSNKCESCKIALGHNLIP